VTDDPLKFNGKPPARDRREIRFDSFWDRIKKTIGKNLMVFMFKNRKR
jgi:hypothetical protein